jgi:hypothetical protein
MILNQDAGIAFWVAWDEDYFKTERDVGPKRRREAATERMISRVLAIIQSLVY